MKEETMTQSFKGFLTSLTELTDKQKKHIDKNNNGKIDGHDFKLLRKEDDMDEGMYSSDVERAFPNGKASGVKTHAPVAPVPDKKYIKGTPENKALKASRKPINGMPTGKMKEETELDEIFADQGSGSTAKDSAAYMKRRNAYVDRNSPDSQAKYKAAREKMAKDKAAEPGKELLAKMKKEEVEELDEKSEQARKNKIMKNVMDASRGAKFKARNDTTTPDPEPQHKTAQAHNKAIGRALRQMSNEEVELDELSKSTLGSYVKKASRDAVITRKIGADFERKADAARSPGMKAASNELSSRYKQKSFKRRDGLEKAVDRLTKEEVELGEAFINGREYASHGLMHPDHAKMHKTGDTRDFYASKTGDKISGKVTKNDGKDVHIKDTSGKTHQFKVTPNLPKTTNEDHKKNDIPFDGPYTKTPSNVKDKSGAVHGPMSRARDLARKAMQKKMKEEYNIEITEEQAADLCDTASINEKHDKKMQADRGGKKSYREFVELLAPQIQEGSPDEKEVDVAENAFDWKKSKAPASSGRYDIKQDGNRTIVTRKYNPDTGHSTGTDDDEKPAGEKRGRGRPSGSTSGAKQKGSANKSDYRGIDYKTHALHLPNSK